MSAPCHRLNESRFRALAEAFGGDISRWPQAEQAAASAWRAANPREAALVLDGARALDGVLDAWRTPAPAEALRSRILASAPAFVLTARRRSFVITFSGAAGLAAACLAGIFVAPLLLPVSAPAPDPAASIALAAPPLAAIQMDEVLTEALAGWEAPEVNSEADPGA